MTSPGKDEKGARGFEGLGDLLSDETETPSRPDSTGRATRSPQADEPQPLPEESPPLPRSTNGPADAGANRGAAPPLPVQAPSQKSVPWGWIAAGAVVILIVLANLHDQSSAPQIEPTTTTGLFDDVLIPNGRPSGVESQSGTPSSNPAPAAEWNESRPPVGENHALSRDQLRYCLAESARIESMETIVNEYNQADVDTFNRYVNDYNSRCGSFRYRPGALELVQREVDAARSRLGQEGRARLRGTSGASRQPVPQPDSTVKAVQERLNALGYEAGPADGLVGAKTRLAIEAFQRDRGIQRDGLASVALVAQLNSAMPLADSAATQRSMNLPVVPAETNPLVASQLTSEERSSLESACYLDKVTNGPAAYNRCIERQVTALQSVPRGIDLSSLTSEERRSLESACYLDKATNGPAAYNRCIERQVAALQSVPRGIDLSGLTSTERSSLESACYLDRATNGPAAYNRCIARQLEALNASNR